MCEQKCISEQYSNRAKLVVKRNWGNIEEPLHHMYILKINILKVYGQTDINILLNHVVFCLAFMI